MITTSISATTTSSIIITSRSTTTISTMVVTATPTAVTARKKTIDLTAITITGIIVIQYS